MNKISKSRPPILKSSGRVNKKALKIILKLFAFLKSLKTLPTLKDLTIEVAEPRLADPIKSRHSDIKVSIIITRSKIFHLSLK